MEFDLALSFFRDTIPNCGVEDAATHVTLFTAYHNHLTSSRYTVKTVRQQLLVCLQFLSFSKVPVWTAGPDHVRLWLHHLRTETRLSSFTIQQHAHCVRGLYDFLSGIDRAAASSGEFPIGQIVTESVLESLKRVTPEEIR